MLKEALQLKNKDGKNEQVAKSFKNFRRRKNAGYSRKFPW